MPNIIGYITDFHAPELTGPYARLTQNQLRSRGTRKRHLHCREPRVISGHWMQALCRSPLLMERRQITGPAAEILTRCGDAPIYTADRELLAALTGYELTRGVLCAFNVRSPAPWRSSAGTPGGGRAGGHCGFHQRGCRAHLPQRGSAEHGTLFLSTPSCCDPLCRRAVRVSMGTVFQVPWAQIGETSADWPEKGLPS